MNYTTNYHLPQWVETDRIQMEDFNQMCAAIDQGIKGAQDTAETAQANASAAQTAADAVADAYTPDNKPYVIGTYTGTGSYLEIDLGFKPSALIILGEGNSPSVDTLWRYSCIVFPSHAITTVGVTNTGFGVGDTSSYPKLGENYRKYTYIAFR